MKVGGLGDAQISQALGHCSDVARKFYGQAQMGSKGGGVAPLQVRSARPVTHKKQCTVQCIDLALTVSAGGG